MAEGGVMDKRERGRWAELYRAEAAEKNAAYQRRHRKWALKGLHIERSKRKTAERRAWDSRSRWEQEIDKRGKAVEKTLAILDRAEAAEKQVERHLTARRKLAQDWWREKIRVEAAEKRITELTAERNRLRMELVTAAYRMEEVEREAAANSGVARLWPWARWAKEIRAALEEKP